MKSLRQERADNEPPARLRELRDRMDQGLGEADRGEGVDGEEFLGTLINDLDRARWVMDI